MAEALTRRSPIHLTYENGEVIVAPADHDAFFLSAVKAAEAYRETVRDEQRVAHFKIAFLQPLRRWCVAHEAEVRACYLGRPARHLRVFIVTKTKRFDFDLAEKMAALELELARAGWRVGVLQLPDADEESLAAFFNPDGALEVYAKR
jgi:hypothetical protein